MATSDAARATDPAQRAAQALADIDAKLRNASNLDLDSEWFVANNRLCKSRAYDIPLNMVVRGRDCWSSTWPIVREFIQNAGVRSQSAGAAEDQRC